MYVKKMSTIQSNSSTAICISICLLPYIVCIPPLQVAQFDEDPLVYHGRIRPGWVAAIMYSVQEIQQVITKISLPLLLLHGLKDPLVHPSASEFAYQSVSSQDKTLEVNNWFIIYLI